MSNPQQHDESIMPTHDSTDPPAMPGASSADSTGPWVIEKVKKARLDSSEALELSRDNASALQRIEGIIGISPNQALGTPGSGLLGGFATWGAKLDALTLVVENLVKELANQRAAADTRRAAFWFVAKVAISTIVGSGVVGTIAWIVTLHH